jgi:phage gp36-like protein
MFLEIEEMKSVMYNYQMDEITENDDTIVAMAIKAAVSEMKSYLNPSNQKQWQDGRPLYDVGKIFSAGGENRDPLILEICKDIACYRVCRLANVDIIHEHVKERYDRAIDWLSAVAGVGEYKGAPTITPDLPTIDNEDDSGSSSKKLFRWGSRPKFNYE